MEEEVVVVQALVVVQVVMEVVVEVMVEVVEVTGGGGGYGSSSGRSGGSGGRYSGGSDVLLVTVLVQVFRRSPFFRLWWGFGSDRSSQSSGRSSFGGFGLNRSY
ncbi:unnamed protein product [Microthlaspi erraticum]|uniref:Uncharacterized protein n=1 Tax=Microthlaspi erraticum TaxID=1685480 RepID=A0A6D2I363_9BRAS|nr:unnamed protein product [Microthlaspi erraticum]